MGTDIIRYDIYGPDVVIANKMESGGVPGKICVSEKTRKLLEDSEICDYTFEEHKDIEIKSMGTHIKAYFVNFQVNDDESQMNK